MLDAPLPTGELCEPISVDVGIPVYNEERSLEASLRELHAFLEARANFEWQIIVVDNASTDETPNIVRRVGDELGKIRLSRLEKKGKGLAIRTLFTASEATVVSFMDADLSTQLKYFPLLIDGLRAGYDVAIGNRLMPAARSTRGAWREIVSRGYNSIVKLMFANGFSDCSCGFKAFRREVCMPLVREVENNTWFFDTELLLLADYAGLRIFEIPVEWVDDPDSKVRVSKVGSEYLVNLARLRLTLPLLKKRRRKIPSKS